MKVQIDKTLGYEYIYDPDHPLANRSGKVYYHRIVASNMLGRLLRPNEHVHHIDGNKTNNHIDNLVVLTATQHVHQHRPPHPITECAICGKKTRNRQYCSNKCSGIAKRKVTRPSKDTLKHEMKHLSWLALGRKYKVSDNAVRKWARSYKLL